MAAWTGTEMFIWGGWNAAGVFPDGALYNPTTQSWEVITSISAPTPRAGASAVWTGAEIVVYGGSGSNTETATTGSRFNPTSRTWRVMSHVPGRPPIANGRAAAWTGAHVLFWDDEGAAYDLVTDTWTPLPFSGLAPRSGHSAIWTGREFIVWGGGAFSGHFNDGAAFNPDSGTWRPLSTFGAPQPRADHLVAWTGRDMVVWSGTHSLHTTWTNDGAMYDVGKNAWRAITLVEAPQPGRTGASMVWSGEAVHFFGGHNNSVPGGALYGTLETLYPRGLDALFGDGFD